MTHAAQALNQSALVVVPERGTLSVTGPDRHTWLNGVLTCDVAAVTPGKGALGLILNRTGKIQADVWMVASETELFLSLPMAHTQPSAEYLERMLVMEDAELSERSEDRAWLAVFGPRALELAERVANDHGGAWGSIAWSALPGGALCLPRPALGAALDAFRRAGAAVASDEEWQRFRVEQGIGLFGVDFDEHDNPHEASLDQRAVSWTKGCYLGQEVVCMQGMRGKVKRRLVRLELERGDVPARGASVQTDDGKTLGEVTSGARGLSAEHPIVLARVSGAALESAVELSIGGARAAVVP